MHYMLMFIWLLIRQTLQTSNRFHKPVMFSYTDLHMLIYCQWGHCYHVPHSCLTRFCFDVDPKEYAQLNVIITRYSLE